MKIALYSRPCGAEELPFIHTVIGHLQEQGFEVLPHSNCHPPGSCPVMFQTHEELRQQTPVDCMISIGGDGSFIDAANLVGDLNIPLTGINTGRIGFLSGIKRENYLDSFQMLRNHQYTLEERFLLHLDSSKPHGLANNFVVNDITIRSTHTDSIIAVTVWADGQKVNTYWGDGLIIATPTGSTAYSMSCGGPILHPQSQVQVLTPIAPHSLNVRPLVIPADSPLTVEVDSRSGNYTLCLDTQRTIVDESVRLWIHKENFQINTISFEKGNFYNVIREKLLWGIDKRNQ